MRRGPGVVARAGTKAHEDEGAQEEEAFTRNGDATAQVLRPGAGVRIVVFAMWMVHPVTAVATPQHNIVSVAVVPGRRLLRNNGQLTKTKVTSETAGKIRRSFKSVEECDQQSRVVLVRGKTEQGAVQL